MKYYSDKLAEAKDAKLKCIFDTEDELIAAETDYYEKLAAKEAEAKRIAEEAEARKKARKDAAQNVIELYKAYKKALDSYVVTYGITSSDLHGAYGKAFENATNIPAKQFIEDLFFW